LGNSRHSFPDPSFRLLLGDKKKDLPTKVGMDKQVVGGEESVVELCASTTGEDFTHNTVLCFHKLCALEVG
jgi:hypothetical protein